MLSIIIAIRENVCPCFLEYIGYMVDVNGKKLFLFNIMDDNHPRFKSTIGIRENEKSINHF